MIFYALLLTFGIFTAVPNLLTKNHITQIKQYVPFFPERQVTLGLDLRGGSSLELEIDNQTLERERLQNILESAHSLLRTQKIRPQSIRILKNSLVIIIPDDVQRQQATKALKGLASPIFIKALSSPVEDLSIIQKENKISITLTENAIKYHINNAVNQSIEIIRQRIDKIGVSEPAIQRIGDNRIQVQLPGIQDPEQLRSLVGTTAKISFHLVEPHADIHNPPLGVSILPDYRKDSKQSYPVQDKIALDGSTLINARVSYEHETNQPRISFELNHQGAQELAQISKENIGRAFAIVLDDKVLTAPTIQSVIPNGRGEITGNFTTSEAVTLSALLRAGALPAPLKIVQQHSVGPDLGADAIKRGIYTGILGFTSVILFIVLLYGIWGIIADIALALHTILIFSVLSLLNATLTLPGIAGIILGIGITVDANILINERIREEHRKGIGALAALDRGFKHALSTIIDANITIIIASLLLWYFGTGPVRGFAVTMFFGIIISMFTNILIVRILMEWIIRKWKIKRLHIRSFLHFIPTNTKIRFMKARFIGLALSIAVSGYSVFLFFNPGLNYGLDFKGGIQLEVMTQKADQLTNMRSTLSKLHLGEIALQNIDNQKVIVRIEDNNSEQEAQTRKISRVKTAIQALYPDSFFSQIEMIGPKISDEIAKNAFLAVVFSGIAMSLYILWRFGCFVSISAIATLILDTTKMIGVFGLFQFDFNLTAIAALMTIIGYSVNDKVVVYDRIRENLHLDRTKNLREIIDISVNQVLIRCIFTTATTTLSILPMAIWGEQTLSNFAQPVIIGIIIATSSSIFISAPILMFLSSWWKKKYE
jgi:SecD/SecF fusion protein